MGLLREPTPASLAATGAAGKGTVISDDHPQNTTVVAPRQYPKTHIPTDPRVISHGGDT